MEPSELNQVRKIIERSTSKVSLRDLERKGFRKVKVLRSTDIDQMIRNAVATALAAGERDRDKIIAQSREALKQQMAEAKAQAQSAREADELIARLRQANRELELANEDVKRKLDVVEARAGESGSLRLQLDEAERRVRLAEQKSQDLEDRYRDKASSTEALRRRVEEAEARALGAESRAATAEKRMAKHSEIQMEADELRMRLKRVEAEKRLIEELEVVKLRERIDQLESALVDARSQSGAVQPTSDDMRAVLREVLAEVGASTGGSTPEMAAEFHKLHAALSRLPQGEVVGLGKGITKQNAALAAKMAIEGLFDDANPSLRTNIENVKVKETTSKGVGSSLNKLKNLRKKLQG